METLFCARACYILRHNEVCHNKKFGWGTLEEKALHLKLKCGAFSFCAKFFDRRNKF
jgi:hypothetical protein